MKLAELQKQMDKIKDSIEDAYTEAEELFGIVEDEGVEADETITNNAIVDWVQDNLTEYIRAQQHRFSIGLDTEVNAVDMFNQFTEHIKSVTPEITY
jgi:hypothetical protein